MQLTLWKMACEDYQILYQASKKTRRVFTFSGVVMGINYMLSLLGLYQFFEIIFVDIFIALLLGAFVTIVFMNIYKLCLTTLNKNEKTFSLSYLASLLGRLIFVGFIGLLIIKGFESFLIFTVFEKLTLADYEGKILLSLRTIHSKFPWIWMVTITLLTLFILPFFIKVSIKAGSIYIQEKKTVEKNLILEDYKRFKKRYATIFQRDYNLSIEIKEHYLDPPFNTIPLIVTQNLGTTEDFIKFLNSEEVS